MKIIFISLGCDKNLVDSEVMLGLLRDKGYEFTDDEAEADVIVINTCCFIHDAKEESIQTILDMAEYKKPDVGCCRALIVTGCLAQRYRDEMAKELPEVDAIVGTTAYDQIVEAMEAVLAGEAGDRFASEEELPLPETKRILTTGGYYAYLKIAEGCDKHCTYCVIPQLRGHFRSVPMKRLIAEARELAEAGVRELIIIAQETTLYGKDLYGKKTLPELLRKLAEIDGIKWLRIMYCYPEEINDELIQVMKEEKKVCHYLDLPIQHASDHILSHMGRKTSNEQLRAIIGRLRNEIPDICLRTTLITGFPGETKKEHELLMDFVDEMEFERLGVFTYSPKENTPAAEMPDQISEKCKKERQAELMELQQEIAFEHADSMVGREIEALIEGKVVEENAYVARTYMDAPNVDGYLFINTDQELMSGDFVQVRITGAHEYDLIGELV